MPFWCRQKTHKPGDKFKKNITKVIQAIIHLFVTTKLNLFSL